MRRQTKALAVFVAALFLLSASAVASLTHNQGSDLDGSTVPNQEANGGFGSLGGLAVAPSGGDLHVVDTAGSAASGIEGSGAVHRFDSAGAYLSTLDGTDTEPESSLSLSTDSHAALDSSGDLFLTDTNNGRVLAFDSTGAPLASFGTDGQINGNEELPGTEDKVPTGGFGYLCGISVDPVNGDVLVSDAGNNRIWIFGQSGAYQGRISDSAQLNGPCGLAFDSTGELYVRNSGLGNVVKFHRVGARAFDFERNAYDPTNGTPEDGSDDLPGATDVAVDLTNDHLYVDAGSQIREFENWGGHVATFGQGAFPYSGNSTAIAVDGAGGTIYATDGNAVRTFSTALTTLPDAVTGGLGEVTGETAVVKGTVDPAGGPEAECSFEYGTDESYGQSAPCEPAGTYSGFQEVSAQLTGLDPATTYHYRLHASSAEGDSYGADRTFMTDGPPAIESLQATEVTTSAARLRATINPAGAATTYRFEYTTYADFEAEGFAGATSVPVPDANVGSGSTGVAVSQLVSPLQPDTRYAFRLIAENATGTTESSAKAFKTFPLPAVVEQGAIPGRGFLPQNRAWELATPPQKNGADVIGSISRVQAAAGESGGLPMAVQYTSLGAFGDVRGTSLVTEYVAQRTGQAGTPGWASHTITSVQKPGSFFGAAANMTSQYEEFSQDLTSGVYRSWAMPIDDPNVAEQTNLYRREDLRQPGAGTYNLLTGATSLQPPPNLFTANRTIPRYDGGSEDLSQVVYESTLRLTADALDGDCDNLTPATFCLPNAYKYGPDGPRLLAPSPGCAGLGGVRATSPCSSGGRGRGLGGFPAGDRIISSDGSRVSVSSPLDSERPISFKPGAVTKLYQLDDRGTGAREDDAFIQVNASELDSPEVAAAAVYQTASADGSRVFFFSTERLTESAPSSVPGGLYMWARQDENEQQELKVDATGGTFTLTASRWPSVGSGTLTAGSPTVAGVKGSFTIGQTIEGPGIAPETTVTAIGTFNGPASSTITLSQAATADVADAELEASVQASTQPLPFDASAGEIEDALSSLAQGGNPILGEGNVTVSGGPGDEGATHPYALAFGGGLAGVNVMPLRSDGSGLTGGAASAEVTTVNQVENLSLISPSVDVVLGASRDGHHLYLGGPAGILDGLSLPDRGIFYWQDAEGPAGGTLSLVGGVPGADMREASGEEAVRASRVTPDGLHLLFQASKGDGLAPQYEHGRCERSVFGTCRELYLYDAAASSPLDPDVICVSCSPTGQPVDGREDFTHPLSQSIGLGSSPSVNRINRALSDDGRYAFFTTDKPLAPEDTNGTYDAYEYDTQTGKAHLLSSGTDSSGSYLMDASRDGSDVFILTRERLSGWDVDEAYDLYDARIDGGFPEPPPPAPSCQGDACQPPPLPLVDPSPASASFVGPNSKACKNKSAKGKHHKKHRKQCRKHHRKNKGKRSANADRRMGR